MKELISYLAKALAARPEEVEVTETEDAGVVSVSLKVATEDLNVIIGKQGRTAKAMRSLLAAASVKKGRRYFLEIVGDRDEGRDAVPAE